MKDRQHRVLVLVAASTVNTGPVKGILQFMQHICELDVQFHLYNFWQHNNPVPDPFETDTQKIGIPCSFIHMGRNNYPLMVWNTLRAVRERQITIIQTHGFKPSFIGLCVKYLGGIKWVCFMHGTTAENWKVKLYNVIDSIIQRFADHVVLVTGNQRSKIFDGNNSKRVSVIHNAVNLDHPVRVSDKRKAVRSDLGLSEKTILVAVVGRLSPEKGMDVFIEAFSKIVGGCTEVHAVIVGDGQERARLIDLTQQLNCSHSITFVGHTETPGDFMAEANMLVLPSRSEGIPNVALEAMALGKPVIATAVGGTPEVIEHESSGLLVPSENVDEMTKSILRVINDPEFAEMLSNGAQKRVTDHFSVDYRCKKIVDMYKKLYVKEKRENS